MGRRVFILIGAALTALIVCADAFARAGGGGGYHGGGGSGGGGGYGGGGGHGGGGGGGDLLQLAFWLLFYHPFIGWPTVLVIVLAFIYAQRSGRFAYQSSVIRRGSALLDANERELMVAVLRNFDPAFDEAAFAARAAIAFDKIQSAWAKQDLAPVRPFISDGVYERFALQFEEQKSLGYRNVMENVQVEDVAVAQVQSDHLFDQLSVRIAASASDFKVSLADGKRLSGSDDSGDFAEVWSFLRRRGVQTDPAKPGLIEGNCPNCGAGVEMNQNANCTHCAALLRSGQYDWVLSEITQESEWVAGARTDLPSVAAMIARDPEFNLQDLEDRASVMFWRKSAAERTGTIDPLRKIASPTFCDSFAPTLRADDAGDRQYYGDCAVGSVDTLGLIVGEGLGVRVQGSGDAGVAATTASSPEPRTLNPEPSFDYALVEVRWEGSQFEVRKGRATDTRRRTLSRTVFELARRSGAKTDAGRAISSAHCPNCGAPEPGGTSPACPFCGTVLNDGTRGWVLTAIRSPNEAREMLRDAEASTRGTGFQPVSATPESGSLSMELDQHGLQTRATGVSSIGLLAWMIQMALSDGVLDERETEMLARVAAKRNIPRPRLDGMIDAARAGKLDLPQPSGAEESRQWIRAMATAALADGKLTRDEYTLLLATGQRVGLIEYDVKALLKKLREDLYASSKGALKERRRGN